MKVELSITGEAEACLIKVQKRTGHSEKVILQRALALYDLLTECQNQGDKIVVRHTDGDEVLEVK